MNACVPVDSCLACSSCSCLFLLTRFLHVLFIDGFYVGRDTEIDIVSTILVCREFGTINNIQTLISLR